MKQVKNAPWSLLALQLLINVCHVSIHHFALDLLWTKDAGPSALSKLLIFGGGLSCIALVGTVGGRLQRKQKLEQSDSSDDGAEASGSVLLIAASFAVEGLTLYLVQ